MNSAHQNRENRLWRAFLRNASERNHEALWNNYQPLVRFIADRFNQKMCDSVDQSELIDAGNVGLLDAIAGYQPTAESRFAAFAVPLIRESIMRSLAVQRARDNSHILRLELAEVISQIKQTPEPERQEIVFQIELGKRERAMP